MVNVSKLDILGIFNMAGKMSKFFERRASRRQPPNGPVIDRLWLGFDSSQGPIKMRLMQLFYGYFKLVNTQMVTGSNPVTVLQNTV
jgi:hypothetical protein